MLLPMPGTTIYCVYAPPVVVPRTIHSNDLDHFRQILQTRLDEAQAYAESIAEGRTKLPPSMSWDQAMNFSSRGSYDPA
jgi:hypothetical protein